MFESEHLAFATQHADLFVSFSTHVASAQMFVELTALFASQSNLLVPAVDTSYESEHFAFASQHTPVALNSSSVHSAASRKGSTNTTDRSRRIAVISKR